jgi:membrane carboxypeptidase/penicillin-binding protein PbpC
MKNIFEILFLTIFCAGALSCAEESGNPPFGPDEVYLYDNKATTMTFTKGEEASLPMVVSPADGSVNCRWLLDDVVISAQRDLTYKFDITGTFALRFEATKGTRTVAKSIQVTVIN